MDPTNDARTGSDVATWTIAQVADEFAITHRAIRHYEDLGLISPERRSTVRIYHRRDRTRLNLILRGKRLGFSLREVSEYLSLYDADRTHRTQVNRLVELVDKRVALLERQLGDLRTTIAELGELRKLASDQLAHGS